MMKKVDLNVSFGQPELVEESDEIVVFRYRLEPFKGLTTDMEEVAEKGELVYRTVDLTKEEYSFIDEEKERGEWYYAVFAKNKAGISPGQIDMYFLADVELVINNFDYKTFSPGRLSFDVEIGGTDAFSWRWKVNDGEYINKSIDDLIVDQELDLPTGQEHELTVESLNVDGFISATRNIYFSIYNISIEFDTHPLLPQPNIEVSGTQDTLIPLNANDIRGHYFIGWEQTGFGIIEEPLQSSTNFRIFNADAQIKGVFGLIDYDIKMDFIVNGYPDRNILTGGTDSNNLPYSYIGTLQDNSGIYNIFDVLNLVFYPGPGYSFASWSIVNGNGEIGDELNASTVYRVDNSDTLIRANINPIDYLITVDGDIDSFDTTGRPLDFQELGSGLYNIDNKVEILAVPDAGYKFESWMIIQGVGLLDDITSARTVLTVGPADSFIRAVYSPIDYTVNVADGSNGTAVASKAAFPNNIFQTMTVTATPDIGWQFSSWEISGPGSLDNPTSNPAVFTVGAGDSIITPKYEMVNYNVRVDGLSGEEAILNINGTTLNTSNSVANYGDSVTIRAIPERGFTFDRWESNISGITYSDQYNPEAVLSMPASDIVISAVYNSVPYTVTVNGDSNGSGVTTTPSTIGANQYYYESAIQIQATANTNYEFSNWSNTGIGSISDPNSSSTTFTVGLSDDIITANFVFVGRQQNIVGTTAYQAFKELEFRWTRSALDNQAINDNGTTTYTYEISTSSSFNQLVEAKVFTTFQTSTIFSDLIAYTKYYCRCRATGNVNAGAVTGTSNTVEFVTNPCGNYTMTKDSNNNLQISGAAPNSGITISEQTGSLETRGLVRPIANDQFNNLFIAEGSGQVRTQTSGPGGRLVFDGGFPKFYNSKWASYSAGIKNGSVSIYDSSVPAQYPYFYNAISHVEREEGSQKKLLYINDAPGGNYTAKVFHNTVLDIARVAGFTASSIGSESASTHSGYLQNLHTTRSAWKTYFNGYDVIVWLGTNYTGGAYLPNSLIQGLLDYFDEGGGLFIITDHNTFQSSVNQILPYYGVRFTGNIDRTAGNNAYKISTILANTNYIPSGYHPLFANINPNGFISAAGSEGEIIYDTNVSNTSNYTTDSNGNLTITNHSNGTSLGGGNTFIRTASDCGGQV
jgi:hypothetical protein